MENIVIEADSAINALFQNIDESAINFELSPINGLGQLHEENFSCASACISCFSKSCICCDASPFPPC